MRSAKFSRIIIFVASSDDENYATTKKWRFTVHRGDNKLIRFGCVLISDVQIDHLDVTNEEEVKSVIKKYTSQTEESKKVNTIFNCAG